MDAGCPGGTCVKPFVFQTTVSGESTCDGNVTFGFLQFGSFTGTISGDCASGTWSGNDGSSGTWMGCRVT